MKELSYEKMTNSTSGDNACLFVNGAALLSGCGVALAIGMGVLTGGFSFALCAAGMLYSTYEVTHC